MANISISYQFRLQSVVVGSKVISMKNTATNSEVRGINKDDEGNIVMLFTQFYSGEDLLGKYEYFRIISVGESVDSDRRMVTVAKINPATGEPLNPKTKGKVRNLLADCATIPNDERFDAPVQVVRQK